VNVVSHVKHENPSPRIAAPIDTMVCGALKEGIAQLKGAEHLGLEGELQQGNFRLQELEK